MKEDMQGWKRKKDRRKHSALQAECTTPPDRSNSIIPLADSKVMVAAVCRVQSLSESELLSDSGITVIIQLKENDRDRLTDVPFKVLSCQIRDCSLETLQLEYQKKNFLDYCASTIFSCRRTDS